MYICIYSIYSLFGSAYSPPPILPNRGLHP